MSDKLIKISNLPNYDTNPSLLELRKVFHRYNAKIKGGLIGSTIVNGEAKAVYDADKSESRIKDPEPFYKGFKGSIDAVRGLSRNAQDMYYMILEYLLDNPNTDKVIMPKSLFAKYTGKKTGASYYNALKELLMKQVLYRVQHEDYSFFINVNMFYNGDRVKLYKSVYGDDLSDDTENEDFIELNRIMGSKK